MFMKATFWFLEPTLFAQSKEHIQMHYSVASLLLLALNFGMSNLEKTNISRYGQIGGYDIFAIL